MRKLAARCRRVRHAKKMRSPKLDADVEKISPQQIQFQNQLQFQSQQILQRQLLQQQQQQQSSNGQQQFNSNSLAATVVAFEVAATESNNGSSQGVLEESMEINDVNLPNNVLIKTEINEPMDVGDVSTTSGASGEIDSLSSTSPHTPLSTSSRTHSNATPNLI